MMPIQATPPITTGATIPIGSLDRPIRDAAGFDATLPSISKAKILFVVLGGGAPGAIAVDTLRKTYGGEPGTLILWIQGKDPFREGSQKLEEGCTIRRVALTMIADSLSKDRVAPLTSQNLFEKLGGDTAAFTSLSMGKTSINRHGTLARLEREIVSGEVTTYIGVSTRHGRLNRILSDEVGSPANVLRIQADAATPDGSQLQVTFPDGSLRVLSPGSSCRFILNTIPNPVALTPRAQQDALRKLLLGSPSHYIVAAQGVFSVPVGLSPIRTARVVRFRGNGLAGRHHLVESLVAPFRDPDIVGAKGQTAELYGVTALRFPRRQVEEYGARVLQEEALRYLNLVANAGHYSLSPFSHTVFTASVPEHDRGLQAIQEGLDSLGIGLNIFAFNGPTGSEAHQVTGVVLKVARAVAAMRVFQEEIFRNPLDVPQALKAGQKAGDAAIASALLELRAITALKYNPHLFGLGALWLPFASQGVFDQMMHRFAEKI